MRRRPSENRLQVVAVTGRNGPQEERVVVELQVALTRIVDRRPRLRARCIVKLLLV